MIQSNVTQHSITRIRNITFDPNRTIVSKGGMVWMVMSMYWRKCLLLVGERKFYGHVTAKDSKHVTMKDYTN